MAISGLTNLVPGATVVAVSVGPIGPAGVAGPIGAIGPIGPIGPVGPVGPIGPVGPPGLQLVQNWAAGTQYQGAATATAATSMVFVLPGTYNGSNYPGGLYQAKQTAVSSSSFGADLAAGLWQIAATSISLAGVTYTTLAQNATPYGTVTVTSSGAYTLNLYAPPGPQGASGNGSGNIVAGTSPSVAAMRYLASGNSSGTTTQDGGPVGLPINNQLSSASYAFAASDLGYETRRANGGAAMSDTMPPTTGGALYNGARFQHHNADTTASITVSAGAGNVITVGGAQGSVVIGPGRTVLWVYDATVNPPSWRATANSLSSMLTSNALAEIAAAALQATARTNIGAAAASAVPTQGQIYAAAYGDPCNSF